LESQFLIALLPRLRVCLIALVCLAQTCFAHDPSAWGGTFRSRDSGESWMPIDAGLFVGGAIMIAVDPIDPNHLLYATDTRLMRSHNGGRDWVQERSPVFIGPTLAVAFAPDGKAVLAATAGGVFLSESEAEWKSVNIPQAATPALAIWSGPQPGRFYVVGAGGLYRSDDRAQTWTRIGEALPAAPIALAIPKDAAGALVAIVQGSVYTSGDDGATWQIHRSALADGKMEMIAGDPVARRVWAGGSDRLFVSDDSGLTWAPVGQPLPDADTHLRGVVASADGKAIVVSTPKGAYRSIDAAKTWVQLQGTLPVHLEAGPLTRDPQSVTTLYAPFSLTPYHEMRRRALEGSNLLSQIDAFSLAGAGAFFILFIVAAIYAVRKLMRISARGERTPSTGMH
jgi:photosystem II stability/assembly factor-like uncharacterized protein